MSVYTLGVNKFRVAIPVIVFNQLLQCVMLYINK